jgi:hypothetical protein
MQLPIDSKYSSAIRRLSGNPFTGTVNVTFTSGPRQYTMKASRRQIIAAAILPPLSVGQWVNRHCWAQ